jgi:cyclohexa-1,5-dienecarbonyl-CoA hydratase
MAASMSSSSASRGQIVSPITLSVESGIARVTLSQPPLNILTRVMLRELRDALERLSHEASLRVLLLSAEGRHFSAGADVSEHVAPQHLAMIPEFIATVTAFFDFPLPTVVAVQGRCLGGGFELVQAADVIVAGEGATFGQPEIALGVTAPAACALLPRRGPAALAAELLLSGDTVSASRLRDAGLIQHVVPDERIDAEAMTVAGRMARRSGAALRVTKRTLRRCRDLPIAEALREAEHIYLEDLMNTDDATEGLNAFVEKREPVWRNR